MNNCTKDTIKNIIVGGGAGVVIGAICGSASGYAGLSQLCNVVGSGGSAACDYLVSSASKKAIQAGCAVGAAVGFATVSFAYSSYKAARAACRREDSAINLGGAAPSSSWA